MNKSTILYYFRFFLDSEIRQPKLIARNKECNGSLGRKTIDVTFSIIGCSIICKNYIVTYDFATFNGETMECYCFYKCQTQVTKNGFDLYDLNPSPTK